MTKKIVLLLLLAALPISLLANEARIHNCTGYNFTAAEWHVKNPCKKQLNISLPRDRTTKISWGVCAFESAKFKVEIAGNIDKDVTLQTDETTLHDRDWYIFAEAPITTEESKTAQFKGETGSKYVRFYLWVAPKKPYHGGLYAISDWYNSITGKKLSDNEANQAGLDASKPELHF